MQKVILFALALLIAVAFAQTRPEKNEYKKPAIAPKSCPRTLDLKYEGKKTLVVTTNTNTCSGTDKRRMEKMQFKFSSVGVPRVSINAQKKKDDSAPAIRLGFGIDRIVEFIEKNGVEGFQQGEDVIAASYKLNTNAWSDIDCTETIIDSTNKVSDCVTTLKPVAPSKFADEVKLTVSVTPIEVSFKVQNTTMQRTVLTPNSFKVSFSLTNFAYVNSSSTGLSIGVVLATKGTVAKRPASRSALELAQSASEVTSDTPSAEQEVHDIADESDATTTNAAYFSFKNFVFKYSQAGILNSTAKLVGSKAFANVDANEKGDTGLDKDMANDVNLRRMWFTPIDTRPSNIYWDPAVGTQESSATASRISFIVLIASFVFALLFL